MNHFYKHSLFILLMCMMYNKGFSQSDIAVANEDGVTIWYNYTSDGKELEVVDYYGRGGYKNIKYLKIPEEVTYMNRVRKVTKIEAGCFAETKLETISLPRSIVCIGNNAFSECNYLNKVIIEDVASWCKIKFGTDKSNPLYYAKYLYSDERTKIRDIIIPEGVDSISDYAFYNINDILSVRISNTVKKIGVFAFNQMNINDGIRSDVNSVVIGDGVEVIGEHAFHGVSIDTITIGKSLREMRSYCFISSVVKNVIIPLPAIIEFSIKNCELWVIES